MSYGPPVQIPLYVEPAISRSPHSVGEPNVTEIAPASVSSVRLEGALSQRLPSMTTLSSYGDAKRIEAEQLANDMRAVYAITRAQNKRSEKISKAKNRAQQRIAERRSRLR